MTPKKHRLGSSSSAPKPASCPPDAGVLLVDDTSRLTRLGWFDSAALLRRLLATGLSVVFVDSGEKYTAESFGELSGALVYLLKAESAHKESKGKARKLDARRQFERVEAAESRPYCDARPS